MKRSSDPTRRRGVAIIEMAIVLPLLLLLLLGGLDFGLQYHVRHCMVNAGREAARVLAVRNGTEAEATTAAMNELAGIGATFTITFPAPSPPGSPDVIVRISVPQADVSLGMFGSPGGTIEIQSTMRKET
jgi:hypothetical protein